MSPKLMEGDEGRRRRTRRGNVVLSCDDERSALMVVKEVEREGCIGIVPFSTLLVIIHEININVVA